MTVTALDGYPWVTRRLIHDPPVLATGKPVNALIGPVNRGVLIRIGPGRPIPVPMLAPLQAGYIPHPKLVTILNSRLTGSVAAGVQASVYGAAVGSGSLFAMAQAAAMGGVALIPSAAAVVTGAGAGVAAVVAVVIL